MKHLIRTLFIGTIIFSLTTTAGFCGNNGKGNKGVNNGKSAQQRVHGREQAKKNAKIRSNRPDREKKNHNASLGAAIKEEKLAKLTQRQRHERPTETPKEKVERYKGILNALEQARWSYNPHDDRGQGNMGKPTMQDPFGFDKDSDRKELYGNKGRPIRTKDGEPVAAEDDVIVEDVGAVEEVPAEENVALEENVVVEEATPVAGDTPAGEDIAVEEGLPAKEDIAIAEAGVLDASIDFSSIDSMEWLVNWYERTVASYYNDPTLQERISYEEWNAMWYKHFFPGGDRTSSTGIRLNNTWDTTERYSYDVNLNNFAGDAVEVKTQMVLAEDYTSSRYYDNATGAWVYESTDYKAGDVVYELNEEATVDPTTGVINVGIAATEDMIGYSSTTSEVYIDMVVTVTDPTTGSTYTQSYDKALYLYRCPYGKVYDSVTSRPIVNAKVVVHFEDGSIVPLDRASNPTASNPQTTDATGRYGFKLETNRKYFMTATADGYEEYKSPVFTEKWHVLREDIALNPIIGGI